MPAASSIAPSTAIRRSAVLFRARLIHLDVSAAYLLAVESSDSLFRFIVVGHFNECEAARAPRFSVHRDVDTAKVSERFEQRPQVAFGCFKIQISNK
jgi:hypothetical protein